MPGQEQDTSVGICHPDFCNTIIHFSIRNWKMKIIKKTLFLFFYLALIFNPSISFSDLFDVSTLNYQDLQCCDVSDHSSMSSLLISIL